MLANPESIFEAIKSCGDVFMFLLTQYIVCNLVTVIIKTDDMISMNYKK